MDERIWNRRAGMDNFQVYLKHMESRGQNMVLLLRVSGKYLSTCCPEILKKRLMVVLHILLHHFFPGKRMSWEKSSGMGSCIPSFPISVRITGARSRWIQLAAQGAYLSYVYLHANKKYHY